jgi:hypothetical protein
MLSHRNLHAASIALAVLFVGVAGPNEANAVDFECDNFHKVRPGSYAIGLLPDSVRERGRNELTGEAIVLIKPTVRLLKDFYPAVAPGLLGCQFYEKKEYRTKFVFKILDAGPDQATALKNHIRAAQQVKLDWIGGRWDGRQPTVLLFRQSEQFKPFSGFDVYSPNLAKDTAPNYFANRRQEEVGFLSGFPGSVHVTFDNTVDVALYQPGQRESQQSPPPSASASSQGATPDQVAQAPGATPSPRLTPAQQRAEEQRQKLEQQKAKADAAAKAKADAAKARTDAAAKKGPVAAPGTPAQYLTTAAAPPVQKPIILRFQQKAAWQELIAAEPAIINTFGHCGPAEARGDGYQLTCAVGDDGKVPVRIRGFKTLLVGSNDGPLEERLEIAEFSQPYPPNWKRPRNELITVSGSLRGLLGRQIPLSQGIESADCNATTGPLTITHIVRESLPWPAAPPCLPISVQFPPEVVATDAHITTGCIPGAAMPIRIQNSVAHCWRKSTDAAVQMTAHLVAGFAPLQFDIAPDAVAGGVAALPLAVLLQQMHPHWPYVDGIVDQSQDGPIYEARAVQYQRCSGPVQLPNNSGGQPQLPTPAAAGCAQMPMGMTVTLVQTGATRNEAPLAAFNQSHNDNVQFGAQAPQSKFVRLDELKRLLPVDFTQVDRDNYFSKFGPPGNTASPGVYLFSGECTNTAKNPNKFVAFKGRYAGTEKWPISGAVYDGKVDDALTRCARAVVNTDNPNAPFLTFRLEGSRAVGPRRAIVISAGQRFVGGQGNQAALLAALDLFIDEVNKVKNQAPLSPINVFLVTGEGSYRELFNGEAAAFEPPNVMKQKIRAERENSAPSTPDFSLLTLMPQLKEMERVTIVMDGSDVNQANVGVLFVWINKFGKDNVNLILSGGNCPAWKQNVPNLNCETLPVAVDGKRSVLFSAFDKHITKTTAEAAAPPGAPPGTRSRN